MSWAVLDELNVGDLDAIGSDGSLGVRVVERVVSVVARDSVAGLSDEALLAALASAETSRAMIDAISAHLTAEAHSRGVTDERQGLRTGHWVARETHQPIGACTRRVTVATRLRDEFPLADLALSEGRISWFHAEVLCHAANPRVAEQIASRLPRLIDLAQELAFKPWKAEVMAISRRLDFDGGYDPNEDPEASKLFLDAGLDDVTFLRGVFQGASGAAIREMIDTRADRLWRRFTHDNTTSNGAIAVPSRGALRALALEELLTEGHAVNPAKTNGPVTDLTVVLHQRPDGWFPDVLGTYDGCETHTRDLRDRLCDAAITFLAMTDAGVPLNLGRTIRFANRDQRRAARARDGGCVFPGCDRPVSWCDCHHVEGHHNGGPTDIRNLPCLCRFHHRVTHRNGWQMFATDDHWYWWQTPHGHTFWSQRHQQQRAGPAPNAP